MVILLRGSRVRAGEEQRVAGEELKGQAALGPDVDIVGVGRLPGENGLGRSQVGGEAGTAPGRTILEKVYIHLLVNHKLELDE